MIPFISINYFIKSSDSIIDKIKKLCTGISKDIVQLNLFDYINDEKSKEAYNYAKEKLDAQYFPITDKDYSGKIYNKAILESKGKYVNFCNESINITGNDLVNIQKNILSKEGYSIYCWRPYRLNDHNVKVCYFKESIKEKKVQGDNFINLILESYFFDRNIANKIKFNEHTLFDFDFDYIIRQIANEKKYLILNQYIEIKNFFENDFYNYPRQYHIEWYNETLINLYLPLIKEYKNSAIVKLSICYLIQLRFACNRNNRNKNILTGENLTLFFEICSKIFNYIDNITLTRYNLNGKKLFPKYMSLVMLKIKYNNKNLLPDIVYSKNELFAKYKDNIIQSYSSISMAVRAINCTKENFTIDCEIINSYIFNRQEIRCFAKINNKKIDFIQNSIYSLDKYFGITMKNGYTGTFVIPQKILHEKERISFHLQYKSCVIKLPVFFTTVHSRLTDEPEAYWSTPGHLLSYDASNAQLLIQKTSVFQHALKEVNLYKSFIKRVFTGKAKSGRVIRAIGLRLLYWITRFYYKNKKIWITYDQLFKGGDNGEYFFRYASDQKNKSINVYYIINKNCDDAKRLKKDYKNILTYNSFKARFMTLHSNFVLATRVDVKLFCGFSNVIEEYYRDLFNYKVLCLQHGLTIQQIAEYQNRLFDNTQGYFCASQYEIKNLLHPVYGYNQNQIFLTGAPRYDGLINNDKHQIIIAPTWRRNVTAGTNLKGEMHAYSVNFKHTEYFKLYNKLINDDKLITHAKMYGYRLIYLIHPILSPQIDDFDKNDYVEIMGGANGNVSYERLLSESSLMITDHSGIQYDFASMRKPIIYYHPETLPPQYEAKTMDYETMGFGPICKTHEILVDEICNYMKNDCKIYEKYNDRISDFFAYTDKNNCKRVYETMLKINMELE